MSNRPKRKVSHAPKTPAKAAADRKGISGTTIGIGAGALVAIVIAVVIALSVGGDDASTTGEQTGFAEIIGDAVPEVPETGDDPAIGMTAPVIRAQTFDDEPISVEPGDGRAKVIGFFAHWCGHCQAELPRLTSWLGNNDVPEGVDIHAVSTAVDEGSPNYPPERWFDREGWPDPVIRDNNEGDLASGYGLTGFPYFVIVGGDGTIVTRTSGELQEQQWEALLNLASSTATISEGTGSE